MRIPLSSRSRRVLLLLVSAFVIVAYCGFTLTEFLAADFSRKIDLVSLQRATRLQPGNADYQYRLGRYFWLMQRSPEPAAQSYRVAVALNPHKARYWFDLAAVYQFLGDTAGQKDALEHAIAADPTTPDVAWEAANLYLVQGETDKALKEFRVVMENDPYLPQAALQLCWRAEPDVDALLENVVPPMSSVYLSFLDLLVSKKETAGAAKVWARLAQLHQSVETRRVFDYMRYLIGQKDVDQANLVWEQSASLCGLSAYQPSARNLVINGDFGLTVLNGGFDWLYHESNDVSLALDPTQFHTGHRSLLISFDSDRRGIEDVGVRQLIPVQPNATYDFSAYFRSENIQGAGGPRFAIQDLYSEATYFVSDFLKDADSWQEVSGTFTTGADTKLLVLRVQRFPADRPIKGKLWIDGVRLVPVER
jgi:tetratricopeptide (TPR) repeat protein